MSPQVDEPVEAASRVKPPACPRCGYDLRGITAVWREECPLDGTCSECGLAFEWGRVFDPRKYLPRWCVEYTHGPRAWWGTIRRLFLPWTFWRALRITHPPRPLRAMGGLLITTVLLALTVYLFVQGSAAIVLYERMRAGYVDWRRTMLPLLSAMEQERLQIQRSHEAVRRGESIDRIHQAELEHAINNLHRDRLAMVVEAFNRGEMTADMLHEQERQAIQESLDWARTLIAERMGMSMLAAVVEAVLFPFATHSSGTFGIPLFGDGPTSYLAPRKLHGHIAGWTYTNMSFDPPSRKSLPQLSLSIGAVLGGAMLLNLFMPITLLLLVQTRKRMRLNPRHLARITIYTTWGLVLAALSVIVLSQIIALIAVGIPGHRDEHLFILSIGFLALLFVSWHTALGRYARVPRPFLVTMIHLSMSALCLILPLTFIPGIMRYWS